MSSVQWCKIYLVVFFLLCSTKALFVISLGVGVWGGSEGGGGEGSASGKGRVASTWRARGVYCISMALF